MMRWASPPPASIVQSSNVSFWSAFPVAVGILGGADGPAARDEEPAERGRPDPEVNLLRAVLAHDPGGRMIETSSKRCAHRAGDRIFHSEEGVLPIRRPQQAARGHENPLQRV